MSFPIGFATGAGIPSTVEMDAAVAFGAEFIRCGLEWDTGSAAPDRDFNQRTAITNMIAYANSIGLGVILVIGAGPTYGGMMYTHSGPGGFDVLGEFALFCANVCRVFNGAAGASDHVWAVEVLNEANHAKINDPTSPYFVHWTGSSPTGPERYAELFLRIVHPSLGNVRATPGCPTIITTGLGGESDRQGLNTFDFTVAIHQTLTFGGNTYTGGLWPNGSSPWFSGFNLHPYCYPTLPSQDTTGGWWNMRQIMAWFQTNRGLKPPLWITEFGQPTKPETLATCLAARDSLQDAYNDLTSRIIGQGWDVRSFAWFSMMNNNKPDDSGNDNYFGIVDRPATGIDPRNGPHKPSPPTVPTGTGQLFDKFVELAMPTTVAVDPTIPNSAPGAPYAADVTTLLNNFLANNANDGDTVLFPVNRVYRIEKPWKFISRNNITINGRGSQLHATVKAPFSNAINGTGTVANCTVGSPRWDWAGNTIMTVTAPAGTAPFHQLTAENGSLAWYVSTPALPGNVVRTQGAKAMGGVGPGDVPDPTDSVIHIRCNSTATAYPPGKYTLTFLSPLDHDRVNIWIEKCTNMVFQNLTVRGANTANGGYDSRFEGQHAFMIRGGNGIEIGNCTAFDAWADSVGCYFDFQYTAAKNVWIHDCDLYGAGRHGITINGLDGGIIENCDIHDVNRHILDVEVNGNMQKAKHVTIQNNRFGNAGIGVIAISTGTAIPADISDFLIDANVCYGSGTGSTFWLPIGTNQNTAVPGTGKVAGEISRWENFTVTNNVSSATQYGTGAAGASWDNAPAEIKVQYCDNVTIQNNRVNMQAGRLMYAVWTEHCTGVTVNGNHDHTATDAFVNPHFESHTDAIRGTATFDGGGTFTAVGHSVPSTHSSAQFFGGGDFSSTGHGVNHGTAVFDGGGTFTAIGRGVNHGTATFDGGGDFTAVGRGENHGIATFDGGGDFSSIGRGVTRGTAVFDGGGDFSSVGRGVNHGTAVFDGGGTFTAVGQGVNHGVAVFDGGGDFTSVGRGVNHGTASFQGGGDFSSTGRGANHGVATFDGGGTFTMAGRTDDDEDGQDGRWLAGAVALRGPGWDETGWDSDGWGGLG